MSFEELDRIPAGKPHRQLPLIRDQRSGKVYLLTQETNWPAPRKHWINDLDSFTRLGFEWADITADWPRSPELYADAPALTYRPVSREQTTFTNADGTFWIVPAWRLQVEDERLLQGLVLANTYNVEWRQQIAPKLAPQGTWIQWGDVPPGAAGVLIPRLNRIILSRALQSEALGVIAAVLTHEVYHAVTEQGRDTASCFAEEAEAFTWEAKTWANLPPQWRSDSPMARTQDAVVRVVQAGRIYEVVSNIPEYQRQCAA